MHRWVSVIVGRAGFDAPSLRAGQPPKPRSASSPQPTAPGLPERRAEVLRGFFPKLASWFETSIERERRREVEAYLSHATDVEDLERRLQQLLRQQNSSFSRYY